MKMDHAEKARQLFLEGYNCAQAVVCAFEDMTGLDRETSARLASSFGGGMGRLREVCGTVSGALLVLGLLCGYSDPKDPWAKTESPWQRALQGSSLPLRCPCLRIPDALRS